MNYKSNFSVESFLVDPRSRRQNCPFLKRIVEMTRDNATLYKNAVESIKDEFKNVGLHSQPFVASLRSGLLMALHDSEHQQMVSNDQIYKFAWCMDACIRSKEIIINNYLKNS
jgi:negative elongation factor B